MHECFEYIWWMKSPTTNIIYEYSLLEILICWASLLILNYYKSSSNTMLILSNILISKKHKLLHFHIIMMSWLYCSKWLVGYGLSNFICIMQFCISLFFSPHMVWVSDMIAYQNYCMTLSNSLIIMPLSYIHESYKELWYTTWEFGNEDPSIDLLNNSMPLNQTFCVFLCFKRYSEEFLLL